MILDSLIYLWGYCVWMLLAYVLRADECRLSRRGLAVFCVLLGLAQAALYIPYQRMAGSSLAAVNTYGVGVWALFSPLVFWAYPRHVCKNLFLLFVAGMIIPICLGPGNLAETLWATPLPPRLLNILITAGVSVPIMAGVLHIQRRFSGLYGGGDKYIWRYLSALACVLFFMQLIAGSIYALHNTTPTQFLLARLATALALFAVLYIAGLAQRQAGESAELSARAAAAGEMIQRKDEAYAKIVAGVEETNRLRHDLRQMFTVLQGMNEPGKEQELEAYCREVLSQMRDAEQEVKRHDAP